MEYLESAFVGLGYAAQRAETRIANLGITEKTHGRMQHPPVTLLCAVATSRIRMACD